MLNNGKCLTDSATVENLDFLSREASVLDERRVLELDDAAESAAVLTRELTDTGLDIYTVLSLVSERVVLGSYPLSDERDESFEPYLRRLRSDSFSRDRVIFTELLLRHLSEARRPLGEKELLPADGSPECIAYVRNSLSDEAYDVLSQEFRRPTVSYQATFRECAEALASGEVGYCLFPLFERGGTRIHAVADLIYRNDFKINAVTPVFGSLGDADVKYALVSKHFTHHDSRPGDDRYLELRVSSGATSAIYEVLSAAEAFGLSVFRTDTVTLYDGDSDVSLISLVLRSSGDDFGALLTHLLLFIPDAVPVGIYKNLE